MKAVIMVNGVPASGKSSVSRRLSADLRVPLLGLDTVKEALFSELGTGDRLYNRKMGRASYAAIFAAIGAFPDGSVTVVDAWFGFQPTELLAAHVSAAGVSTLVEVWCQADAKTVAARYLERCDQRHAGHLGPEYAPELERLAERAKPLGVCPCVTVDTTRPVDGIRLLQEVDRALEEQGWSRPVVTTERQELG